jgi:hypothetical protein
MDDHYRAGIVGQVTGPDAYAVTGRLTNQVGKK